MEKDLFSQSLNEQGIRYLLRFAKLARVLFVASVLLAAGYGFGFAGSLQSLNHLSEFTNSQFKLQVILNLAHLLFISIIIPFQWYFYAVFSRRLQAATEHEDMVAFNDSFRLLNIHAVLSLVAILANLLNLIVFHWLNTN